MSKLRDDLCNSINKAVDESECLGAENIADEILNNFLSARISLLESQVETAHDALNAVYASGVSQSYTDDMINRGLDNKRQLDSTNMG